MARAISVVARDDLAMMKRLLNAAGARSGSEERGAVGLPMVNAEPPALDELVASRSEADSPDMEFGLLDRIGAYGFGSAPLFGASQSGHASSF
jgi:hypothetical protein